MNLINIILVIKSKLMKNKLFMLITLRQTANKLFKKNEDGTVLQNINYNMI